MKTKLIWASGAIIALSICFLLCRYTFFDLHGMKEWPLDLFIFGLIIIVISIFFAWRKVMICTVAGYIVGFVLGMLFNSDGVDQGVGGTNNAWKIWTVSFIVLLLIGVFLELVNKHLKRKNTDT